MLNGIFFEIYTITIAFGRDRKSTRFSFHLSKKDVPLDFLKK
jgi:hypothetical protein